MKTTLLLSQAIVAALLLSLGPQAVAGEEMLDLETRFRAKLAKEKLKQSALERENSKLGKGIDNAQCGSQNIGNVDTGGRIGAAPREVFVFAPNAVNLVTGTGCR